MATPTKIPYAYQAKAAAWMSPLKSALLADEVGVGKTMSAISACDTIHATRILVLCPGIARENWVEEFYDCQTMDRLVMPILGTKVLPDADVLVVSFSLIRQFKVLKYLLSIDWDVLIIDEAHYLKNPVSIQTRAVYGNNCNGHFGLASKAKHVWLLSGTIMPNHPGEIWSHAAALFPDVSQGMTYNQWVNRYCVKKAKKSSAIIGVNKENEAELLGNLKPFAIRRLKKHVLPDLPPLTFGHVTVLPDKLPPRTEEVDQIERVVLAALAKVEKGKTDEAMAAIKAADEIHLASLRKWTGIAKAPAVADYLLEELNAGLDKVVVFAIHQEVIETLLAKLPDSVALYGPVSNAQRQHYIKAFQGKVEGFSPRVIIIQMDIGSAVLTLTQACNVVFAESSWVPKDMEQAAARCHRNGQTRPVLARVFSLKGSVDEQVSRTLVRKIKQIASFNEALITH